MKKKMLKLSKWLFLISLFIGIHFPTSAKYDSTQVKKIRFSVFANIGMPLFNSVSYIALDNINFPKYYGSLTRQPLYEFGAKCYLKRLFFIYQFSTSSADFKGKSFRQNFTVYDNSSNSNVTIYDFYCYQTVKYQFSYSGIGIGYDFFINRKHQLSANLNWLFQYRKSISVSNYFTDEIPITNINNLELAKNVSASGKTSENTLINYGLNVAYTYHIIKYFAVEINVNYFSFKFNGVNNVKSGFSSGIFFNQAPYYFKYSIQQHSSLNTSLGFKLII